MQRIECKIQYIVTTIHLDFSVIFVCNKTSCAIISISALNRFYCFAAPRIGRPSSTNVWHDGVDGRELSGDKEYENEMAGGSYLYYPYPPIAGQVQTQAEYIYRSQRSLEWLNLIQHFVHIAIKLLVNLCTLSSNFYTCVDVQQPSFLVSHMVAYIIHPWFARMSYNSSTAL